MEKNISTKGPRNCRSLGFARDDKKGRAVDTREWLLKERMVAERKERLSLSREIGFSC